VRTRAAGISQLTSLEQKVVAWAQATGVTAAPMLACLADLAGEQPCVIADRVLSTMSSEPCSDKCEDSACVAG
jgi:exonuclease SbcD